MFLVSQIRMSYGWSLSKEMVQKLAVVTTIVKLITLTDLVRSLEGLH